MNLRTFIFSLFTLPVIKQSNTVAKISGVSISELPKPVEKELRFTYGPYKVWMQITKNFIFLCNDGSYEMNIYQDHYKVIGEAILIHGIETKQKRIRFEGKIFHQKDLDKQWEIDKINIMQLLDTLQESQMT